MPLLSVTGAVLAGGKSARMGRDKATLLVGGETLLARQLRLLAEAGCAERLVSVAADAVLPAVMPKPGQPRVLRDRLVGAGPLAGLGSVLVEASHSLVLVIAVDMPALTAVFLRGLAAEATADVGVVPLRDGRYEPLVAVYPRAALGEASARLGRGEFALQAFVRAGLAAGWLRGHHVTPAEEPLFMNWNRPEDIR